MKYITESKVEQFFANQDVTFLDNKAIKKIPVITVENYVALGQITALRFLEWVALNPNGVIALPTGKTPEFFIKWTQHYLQNWDNEMKSGILSKIGLDKSLKPDMKSLIFFQLDEFFPINPIHERSFTYFVKKYYINGFGLNQNNTYLIDTYSFNDVQKSLLSNANNVDEIFPDGVIDLSLRIKKPTSETDIRKQKVIKMFDRFCDEYENKIHEKGGIGFFLGGIGPDGHIAFNVRGSSHHSHSRLTNINYETQAVAASDLGGIELVRKKAVITMGLNTICQNPDTVALIIAAGESKGKVIQQAVENNPHNEFPATALHKLPNARFFVTKSAAIKLSLTDNSTKKLFAENMLNENTPEKILIDIALQNKISLMQIAAMSSKEALEINGMQLVADLCGKTVPQFAEISHKSITSKIEKGLTRPDNQRFMHTAPHHDDIELAYFPLLHHLVRSSNNQNYFIYCTSGFTAVTNYYVKEKLYQLLNLLKSPDFEKYLHSSKLLQPHSAQYDINGYLHGIAAQNTEIQDIHISCRLSRLLFADLGTQSKNDLEEFVSIQIEYLTNAEPGRREAEIILKLKGWLREYEAELVWAHFGIDMDYIHHLRLPFYSDDIFPQYPDFGKDVKPVLELMEKIKPTVITLALDPEGSGPDTHYKTLIALAEAIDEYKKNHPELNLRIWGYRNIWSRYEISEASSIVPVSLNSFAVLHNMFNSCFLSQKSASFPSYELDGTFSELAQKIWVEQLEKLQTLLGRDYFYSSPNPMLRRSYGAIYLKDMSYSEFKEHIKPIRGLLNAKAQMENN